MDIKAIPITEETKQADKARRQRNLDQILETLRGLGLTRVYALRNDLFWLAKDRDYADMMLVSQLLSAIESQVVNND